MHNALALAGVGLVLAITASCARNDTRMQPDPGRGYVLETTGAVIGRDDPQRNERDSTVGEVATRLASQICEREARCDRSAAAEDQCMRAYVSLTALEVATWQCSPAATRARAKQCIAALNAEPCEMDVGTKPELCAASDACPDTTAELLPTGAVLAKAAVLRNAVARDLDREAAATALAAVDMTPCHGLEGPSGPSHVLVVFAPDGGVLTSELDTGPESGGGGLWGTPKGQCVVEQLRKARVPLFEGPPQTIGATLSFQ